MNPNYLSIEALAALCQQAIAAGRGKNPVYLSVDYGIREATTLTEIEDIDDAAECCLVIRDDMKI